RTTSEVLPRLYLTDLSSASNEAQLRELGITHVISIIEWLPDFPESYPLQKLHIPLFDSADANILEHLPTTTSFIQDALAESSDNRVLVHCFMGVSRSATVVCAYLMAAQGMTPHEALAAVKAKRSIVSPNTGFLRQLEMYS
ncbi:protein-tyrosine phosphatase-like protein, partial [Gloeopeniophorella convolvens]